MALLMEIMRWFD